MLMPLYISLLAFPPTVPCTSGRIGLPKAKAMIPAGTRTQLAKPLLCISSLHCIPWQDHVPRAAATMCAVSCITSAHDPTVYFLLFELQSMLRGNKLSVKR